MVNPDVSRPELSPTAAAGLEALPASYIEMYKLAAEMADRISARRMLANTFFVTVNTGLAAFLGSHSFHWYVAIAGIMLSLAWWMLLKSYRDLNSAKYRVIHAMEVRLPAQIFSDEWAMLKRERVKFALKRSTLKEWWTQYRELGTVERVIPWVFAVIYVVAIFSRTDT